MKTKILIDIDGVLAKFYYSFAKFLNENYNTSFNLNLDPFNYDFNEWSDEVKKLNFTYIINEWINQGGYKKLTPYFGAVNFFNELEKKFDLYVVTAREDEILNKDIKIFNKIKLDTLQWFKNNGFKIDNVHINFKYNKVSFCLDNNINIMIEDQLDTAKNGAKNGITTILIDRNWNRSPDIFGIYRVYNFKTAINIINKITR